MSEKSTVNVCDFDAVGDGISDSTPAFMAALDSGAQKIFVPRGQYNISIPLFLRSDTELCCDKDAHISAHTGLPAIFSNKAPDAQNICVCGGIFDGASVPLKFHSVQNLTLSDISVTNAQNAFIACSETENFEIKNICLSAFSKDNYPCGVILDGCRNGTVCDIKTLTDGTIGCMLYITADSAYSENMRINGIYSMECGEFVRLCADRHPLYNVSISEIAGGCKKAAIRADGKCGVRDISLDRAELFSASQEIGGLINISCNVQNFHAKKLCRPGLLDRYYGSTLPSVDICTAHNAEILFEGISCAQIADMQKASRLNAFAITPRGAETLLKREGRLVLPDGGFEKLTITTSEI